MAITVSEAQVREDFSTFLNRVQDGAEIIIERDNVPVARLIRTKFFEGGSSASPFAQPIEKAGEPKGSRAPREAPAHWFEEPEKLTPAEAVAAMRAWRKKHTVGPPLTIEEIISARDEGRKPVPELTPVQAAEEIREWGKKHVVGPPLSIEEVTSARDEGRK